MKKFIKAIRDWYDRLTFDKHRLGSFWCDKHWQVIKDSQKDRAPINAAIAAIGITSALHIKGIDANQVRHRGGACCILFNIAESTPKLSGNQMLNGIFDKSRGW
jgi:hypothetical protein